LVVPPVGNGMPNDFSTSAGITVPLQLYL
jgi:hypothetical protein